MAVELTSLKLVLQLVGNLTSVTDLTTAYDAINRDFTKTFGNGTGALQGNMWWGDTRSVGTGGEDIDFAGGLTSAFGATITFTALKGLLIHASTANTGNVVVTRGASNGLVVFAAANDALAPLKPGGIFLFTDPSAAGLTVTANTGDLLNIAASTGTVSYDIFAWGEV